MCYTPCCRWFCPRSSYYLPPPPIWEIGHFCPFADITEGSDQVKKTRKITLSNIDFFIISDHYWTGLLNFGVPGPHRGLGVPILDFGGPEWSKISNLHKGPVFDREMHCL